MYPDFDCNPAEFRGDEVDADVATATADFKDLFATMKKETAWREAPIDQGAVDKFLRCYWQGRSAGNAASSGEMAAFQLGASLCGQVGFIGNLDGEGVRGLCELIRIASKGYAGEDKVKALLTPAKAKAKKGGLK